MTHKRIKYIFLFQAVKKKTEKKTTNLVHNGGDSIR